MLRAFVLAFYNSTGRQVRQTYGGIGLVNVLTACTLSAVGIFANVFLVDIDFVDFIDFRHDRDSAG